MSVVRLKALPADVGQDMPNHWVTEEEFFGVKPSAMDRPQLYRLIYHLNSKVKKLEEDLSDARWQLELEIHR